MNTFCLKTSKYLKVFKKITARNKLLHTHLNKWIERTLNRINLFQIKIGIRVLTT